MSRREKAEDKRRKICCDALMKALSASEMDHLLPELEILIGARLQKIYAGDRDFVFEFYGRGRENWLWVDLHPRSPLFILWREKPPSLPKQKKPISLFIHAHGVNRHLLAIDRQTSLGRVVRLVLGQPVSKSKTNEEVQAQKTQIEIFFIPHRQNLRVTKSSLEIWWKKPQDLPSLSGTFNLPPDFVPLQSSSLRSMKELLEEWKKERIDIFPSLSKSISIERRESQELHRDATIDRAERELIKRQKLVDKLQIEIEKKQREPWQELGEWLKQYQTQKNLPEKWRSYLDEKKSLSENIQHCFSQSKITKIKILGAEKRLAQIQNEIEEIKNIDRDNDKNDNKNEIKIKGTVTKQFIPEVPFKLKKVNHLRTRKHLISQRWPLHVGKSAKDNLQLLRQARAWDLWLHLRDFPGSFGIVYRNKNETLPEVSIKEAAQWVARETFGDRGKSKQRNAEKLVVLLAECRHVKPIKGDKLGRVIYQNARHLTIVFESI